MTERLLTAREVGELVGIMGTSVKTIEQYYGALIDTAYEAIRKRLETAS